MISAPWASGDVPEQFTSAVSRLHGASWHEQAAGAMELAELAARWHLDGANAAAQCCVDALCAYLRVHRYPRLPGSAPAQAALREQIAELLMDFLRCGPGAAPGGLLVNLAAVRLPGRHVFDGVSFGPGLRLILDRVRLEPGAQLSFVHCRFNGCIVRLHEISLQERAVLSLVGSTVEPGTWLLASTTRVHPTARVDVRGLGPADRSGVLVRPANRTGAAANPQSGKDDPASGTARPAPAEHPCRWARLTPAAETG